MVEKHRDPDQSDKLNSAMLNLAQVTIEFAEKSLSKAFRWTTITDLLRIVNFEMTVKSRKSFCWNARHRYYLVNNLVQIGAESNVQTQMIICDIWDIWGIWQFGL